MNMNSVFKCFSVSAVAMLCSFVLMVAYGKYVPQTMSDSNGGKPIEIDKNRIYTEEELNKAEKNMEERLRRLREERGNVDFKEAFHEAKSRAVVITWIPWFIFPLFLLLKNNLYFGFLILMVLPISLTLLSLVLPLELLIFAVCTYLSLILRKNVSFKVFENR